MRATFLLLLALQSILYADEKAIVIVIPSYNNKEYYKDNLDSVINQNYQNFHILYIDDDSTDGTGSLVQEYIREKKLDAKITLIQNKKRLKALQNIYNAVRMCNPTDIIVTVDGDDFLFGTQVLRSKCMDDLWPKNRLPIRFLWRSRKHSNAHHPNK